MRALVFGLFGFVAVGLAPSAHAQNDGCRVTIHATGTYGATVKTNAPFSGSVDYQHSSGPQFDVRVTGNERVCDGNPLSGTRTMQTRAGRSIYDIETQLHPENDARFHHALLAIFRVTQRNTGRHRVSFDDLFRMTDALVDQNLANGAREVAANIAQELATRHFPSDILTDKGAKFVVDTAVKLMIDHYLRGQDPGQTIDGLKNHLVDHLRSQASELVKFTGGDLGEGLDAALKPYLDGLAKEIKDELSSVESGGQSGSSWTENDDCNWMFSANWNPTTSNYSAIFSKRCGDVEETPTLSPTVPSVNPGDKGAKITIQMFNRLGAAYPLSGATISGLSTVTGVPDPVPARDDAKTRSVTFDVKKPLADRDYPLTITATSDASTGNKTGRWTGTITVLNVPPTIDSVQVTRLEGDPGDSLRFTRNVVIVIDDNADGYDLNEVPREPFTLGPHPAGLRMKPPARGFDRIDRQRRADFDDDTGTYEYTFNRNGGTIESPHMHGDWKTTLTVRDNDNKSATQVLELVVRDVDPTIEQPRVDPRFVHRVDGNVTITGRFRDKNGVADLDLKSSFVDPDGAAEDQENQKELFLRAGLDEAGRGDDWVGFTGTFKHTKTEGLYDIRFHAQDQAGPNHPDGPNSADDVKQLGVGNQKPVIEPWGYIYNSELQVPEPNQREGLCPGQKFLAGAIIKDFENDPLTAWASIDGTGIRAQLVLLPGERTHKAILRAPEEPKEYRLRFTAKEDPPHNEKAFDKTSPLRVIACEDEIVSDFGVDDRVTRRQVCPGEHFTVEAWEVRFEEGQPPQNIYRNGTVTFEGTTRTISPTILAANFNAPAEPGVYGIGIQLMVGDPPGTPTNFGDAIRVVPCDLEEKRDIIDLLEQPDLVSPPEGDRDPKVQLMIIDWVVVTPLTLHHHEASINREIREALFAAAERAVRGRFSKPRILPASASFQPGAPRVQAFLSSLGTSTGEAFDLSIINNGNSPIDLVGDGIVVEPLKKKASELARRELQKVLDRQPVQLKLSAYCLEFLREPPDLNAMFRFAPPELQKQFEPMRNILGASKNLFDAGGLTPDMDPMSYFHSIRQWSIWTEERGFDLPGFEKAFVERTKKNFEAARQPWNKDVETAVRQLVPNRFTDITKILEQARQR